jgi:hypothetical protein
MQLYKFFCNYDETDFNIHVYASSIEDAYSKLDQCDRECAEYVGDIDNLYKIESNNQFTLIDLSQELPF